MNCKMGSICDGTLSSDEFYIAAKALCEKWKGADTTIPNWMWVPYERIHARVSCKEGYLSLENVYHVYSSKDLVSCDDLSEEGSVDSATMVQVPNNMIHVYDYHIVYSFSYRAPVLYFHGHHCDGRPLNLDDIQKDLPEYSLKLLTESKWTFITVEEHPYMHQPWFFLHPCGTSDWMKLLLSGDPQLHPDTNYLSSWLSVVGQLVGLRIPIGLASNFFERSPGQRGPLEVLGMHSNSLKRALKFQSKTRGCANIQRLPVYCGGHAFLVTWGHTIQTQVALSPLQFH